jgi:hypothetical protein
MTTTSLYLQEARSVSIRATFTRLKRQVLVNVVLQRCSGRSQGPLPDIVVARCDNDPLHENLINCRHVPGERIKKRSVGSHVKTYSIKNSLSVMVQSIGSSSPWKGND